MFWMWARITLKPLLCFSFSSICRNVLFLRRILCNSFPASKSLWFLTLYLPISPWKLLLPCHTFLIRFVLRIYCWVNSHHLAAWFCIDNVQRNYFLVIQKRIRVKKKKKTSEALNVFKEKGSFLQWSFLESKVQTVLGGLYSLGGDHLKEVCLWRSYIITSTAIAAFNLTHDNIHLVPLYLSQI